MKNLYKKALESYIEMLNIHIDTKTTDVVFHKETEWFYEMLFDVAHSLWEKYVDLGWNLDGVSLMDKKKRANEIIKSLKEEIETYKENNDISLGTEDMLGSLANSLEDAEWTSRWFLNISK